MTKRILSVTLALVAFLCAMLLVSCQDGGGMETEHLHSYEYSLVRGDSDGAFNVIGRCNVENCDAPEVTESDVTVSLESETAPTCETAGERTFLYNKAGQTLRYTETIALIPHKINGVSEDELYIDGDGKIPYGTEGITIPADATVACEETVVGSYTCSQCSGVVSVELFVGHEGVWYTDSESAADCTAAGKEYVDCTRCGNRAERDTEALGHLYECEFRPVINSIYNVKAKCTRLGCVTPDLYIEGVTDVKETVNKPATCTERGIVRYSFKKGGESMVISAYSDSLTHKILGFEYTNLLNKNGNIPSGTPGFVASGELVCGGVVAGSFKCDLCKVSVDVNIEKAHTPSGDPTVIPADCVNAGKRIYDCSDCGDEVEEAVPMLGHLCESPSGSVIKPGTIGGTFAFNGVCVREGCSEVVSVDGATNVTSSEILPTCSSTGTRTYNYTLDGAMYTVSAVLDKLPHTLSGVSVSTLVSKDGRFNSTVAGIFIDERGNVECGSVADGYYTCDECSLRVSVTVNVIPHTLEAESDWAITEPTCMVSGKIVKECKYCEYTEEETLLPNSDNHVFAWTINSFNEKKQSAVISGVCTEEGCSETILPSHPDDGSYGVYSLGASCKTPGKVVHTWTLGGYLVEYEVELDTTFDHKIGGVYTRLVTVYDDEGNLAFPIDTAGIVGDFSSLGCGKTSIDGMYKCSECSATITARVINPHKWETVSETLADCVNAGNKKEKCSDCQKDKTTTANPLGHSYKGVYTVGMNSLTVTCERDGCDFRQYINDVEPTLAETISLPTCATVGQAKYFYEFLPDGETEMKSISFIADIPKLSHTVKNESGEVVDVTLYKDANGLYDHNLSFLTLSKELKTCLERANATFGCEGCGETVTVVAIRNHVYTYWQTQTPATCTTDGIEISLCDVCSIGGIGERVVPALGYHDFKSDVYTSDETHHWNACSCGQKNNLAEHTFGEGLLIPSTNCEEPQKTLYVCLGCGYERYEYGTVSDFHEYALMFISIDPTFADDGEAILACNKCFDTMYERLPKIELGVNATIQEIVGTDTVLIYRYTLSTGELVSLEISVKTSDIVEGEITE